VRQESKWVSNDGRTFDSKADCAEYEREHVKAQIKEFASQAYPASNRMRSISYNRVMEWEVYRLTGEFPNPEK